MTCARFNNYFRFSPILVGLGLVAVAVNWSSNQKVRPSILLEGKTFDLGTTPPGKFQRHSWEVRNRGSFPLKFRTHFTSGRCGFSLWLGVDQVIPPGGLIEVSLSCPTSSQGNRPYSAHAEVATNDPESPLIRFRVFGMTGPEPSLRHLQPKNGR